MAWRLPTGDIVNAVTLSPNGSTVYAGSWDTYVHAINTTNGKENLRFPTGAPVRSLHADAGEVGLYVGVDGGVYAVNVNHPPSISSINGPVKSLAVSPDGRTVYAGSGNNSVYAVRASDGLYVWKYPTDGPVTSVAVSPHGRTVYAGSGDNSVYAVRASDGLYVWNCTTNGPVTSVAVSPDGRTVYAGSGDNSVYAVRALDGLYVWNCTTNGPVTSVAVSPDGRTVYAGSWDNSLYAVSASDGVTVWSYPTRGWITSVAVSLDGCTVYAGSWDTRVYAVRASDRLYVWNCTTNGPVTSVVVSPDGRTVYAGSWDNSVYAVGSTDGVSVWSYPTNGLITSVAVSPNGCTVYAGSTDTRVYAVRASDGFHVWTFPTNGRVDSVAVSPDGRTVYAGSTDTRVYTLNADLPHDAWCSTGSATSYVLAINESVSLIANGFAGGAVAWGNISDEHQLWRVNSSIFSSVESVVRRDGQDTILYVALTEGFCRLQLDASGFRRVIRRSYPTNGPVESLTVSPDGRTVYAGSENNSVYAVRASDGLTVWKYPTNGPVKSLAVSPDGRTVYAGSENSSVYAVRASDGLYVWKYPINGPVTSLAKSPDGRTVYAGSGDTRVYAVTASDGLYVWNCTTNGRVTSVAVSPDGRTVYAGSGNSSVYAVRASDGFSVWSYPTNDLITSVAVSPDGRTVYAGSWDTRLYAVRASDGRYVWKYTTNGRVTSVAVSPDGRTVYAGSRDTRLYAVKASDGRLLWNYPTNGWITSVAVSLDGRTVYAGSEDKRVYTVGASSGRLLWNYTNSLVISIAVSPDGRTVYAGSWNNSVYALSGCVYMTESRVTSAVLSSAGDVIIAGSVDHYVYAFNASTDQEIWKIAAQDGVTAIALSPSKGTVYAASYDRHIYAVNISNGQEVWRYEMESTARSLAVTPGGDMIYVGSDDFNVYALYAQDLVERSDVNRDVYVLIGTACVTLVALVILLSRKYTCCASHKLVFFGAAGLVFGFFFGAITGFVTLYLPRLVGYHVSIFGKEHRWIRQIPMGMYGYGTVAWQLLWSVVWGFAAAFSRQAELTYMCSAALLVSSLVISFDLVPGMWVVLSKARTLYLPLEICSAWCVLSCAAGILTLVLGLGLFDMLTACLKETVEVGRWTGHFFPRLLMLFEAFSWGFIAFWGTTAVVLYLFNEQGMFVPPSTPLSLCGVVVGLVSLGVELWVRLKSGDFVRTRNHLLIQRSYEAWRAFWSSRGCSVKELLVSRWQRTLQTVKLGLRACIPDEVCGCEVRKRIGNWFQPRAPCVGNWLLHTRSFEEEVDLSLLRFKFLACASVVPLLILWFYGRYKTEMRSTTHDPVELTLRGDYCAYEDGLSGRCEPLSFLPVLMVPDLTPSYLPMDFGDAAPFYECSRHDYGISVDVGDLKWCVNTTAQLLLLYGGDWPRCNGLTTTILAKPSRMFWTNLELLVYVGYLFACGWVMRQEGNEKILVKKAWKDGRLLGKDDTRAWWMRFVVIPFFLLGLSVLYVYCLVKGATTETFLIFTDPQNLLHWSRHHISKFGVAQGLCAASSAAHAGLVWYCDKIELGSSSVLRLTYENSDGVRRPEVAALMGIYFFVTCYSLVQRQRKVYDFVDGDLLMEEANSNIDGYPKWKHDFRTCAKLSRQEVEEKLRVKDFEDSNGAMMRLLFNEKEWNDEGEAKAQ